MRRRSAMGFWPCMVLVTWMVCVTGSPPGCSAVPDAGSSRSCMNLGTAACSEKLPTGVAPVFEMVARMSVTPGLSGCGLEKLSTICTSSLWKGVTLGKSDGAAAAVAAVAGTGAEAPPPKRSSRLRPPAGAAGAPVCAGAGVPRSRPSRSSSGLPAAAGGAAGAPGAEASAAPPSRSIPMRSASASAAPGLAAAAGSASIAPPPSDWIDVEPVAFMYSASFSAGMCSSSVANRPGAPALSRRSNSTQRCCTSRKDDVVCFFTRASTCGRVSGTCAAHLTSEVMMYSRISGSAPCEASSTSMSDTASLPATRSGSSPGCSASLPPTSTSQYSPMTQTETRMSEPAALSRLSVMARKSERTA
mmetsp:Transcript_16889/g.42820  ORF Transcript_16889/g.42820 Transcript_16889/m.42820 type:complete len:360 (+) Transcript_16889:95-1174(+)